MVSTGIRPANDDDAPTIDRTIDGACTDASAGAASQGYCLNVSNV